MYTQQAGAAPHSSYTVSVPEKSSRAKKRKASAIIHQFQLHKVGSERRKPLAQATRGTIRIFRRNRAAWFTTFAARRVGRTRVSRQSNCQTHGIVEQCACMQDLKKAILGLTLLYCYCTAWHPSQASLRTLSFTRSPSQHQENDAVPCQPYRSANEELSKSRKSPLGAVS
jgi:hypothetical protein